MFEKQNETKLNIQNKTENIIDLIKMIKLLKKSFVKENNYYLHVEVESIVREK